MRKSYKVLSAAFGSAVVVGALAVGTAGAQMGAPGANSGMHQSVIARTAAAVGVPAATLDGALTAARGLALADAVKSGQLTQEQADLMSRRHQAMQSGQMGPGPGMGPGSAGRHAPEQAEGMQQRRQAMQSGQAGPGTGMGTGSMPGRGAGMGPWTQPGPTP